jgi:hypothetical protein
MVLGNLVAMFFLIRSTIIAAIIYGLFVWGFGAEVSWTWYVVTTCLVAVVLLIETLGTTTLKWLVILTIIHDLLWDRDYRG